MDYDVGSWEVAYFIERVKMDKNEDVTMKLDVFETDVLASAMMLAEAILAKSECDSVLSLGTFISAKHRLGIIGYDELLNKFPTRHPTEDM